MVAHNLPFGGSSGLLYREIFFYSFFISALLFVFGAGLLWLYAELIAPRASKFLQRKFPGKCGGRLPGDAAVHPTKARGDEVAMVVMNDPANSDAAALSDARSSSYSDATGLARPAARKSRALDGGPKANRRCPWRSWSVHIGLFFTFGLIFVLWVYMGVHGLTNERWQEHMKIYLWMFVWLLLAAAITIWPDTQYIRAVVTGLPFTVGFYLNVATVHLTVWDVWSPVAAGALGFVPLFLGLLYTMTAWAYASDPELRARIMTDPMAVSSNPVMQRIRFAARAVKCAATDRPKAYGAMLAGVVLYCVLTTLAMTGSCLAAYQTRMEGGTHAMPALSFGTWLSRQTFPAGCSSDTPCHVYLGVPHNISDSMLITAHTAVGAPPLTVVFQGVVGTVPASSAMQRFDIAGLEANGERDVHSALLSGLTPATTYTVTVVPTGTSPGDAAAAATKKFRTGPLGKAPFGFTSGGDMGNTDEAVDMTAAAARMEPLFSIVGGDVAYDQGMRSCYRCMDQWLSDWETAMVTPTGYTVPMLIVNGNHDLGANSMDFPFEGIYPFTDPKDPRIPLSLIFFPEEDTTTAAAGVLPPHQRKTYHSHVVGDSLLVLGLDSGYMERFDGPQTQWIDDQLAAHSGMIKTAVYHDPIYPVEITPGHVGNPSDPVATDARETWVPIFDRRHLSAAFENHVHSFKRTYPLTAGSCEATLADGKCSETADGTVYLGDGYWGVVMGMGAPPQEPLLRDPHPIIKTAGLRYHVWSFTVSEDATGPVLNATAIAGVACPELSSDEMCLGAFDSTQIRPW